MKKVKKIVFLLFVVLSLMMLSSIYLKNFTTSYCYADVIGPGGDYPSRNTARTSPSRSYEDLEDLNKALIRFIIVLVIIVLVIGVLLVRFLYDRYQIEIKIKDRTKPDQFAYEMGESPTEKIIHDEDLKSEEDKKKKKENDNIQIELDMRLLFAFMLLVIGALLVFYFVNNG